MEGSVQGSTSRMVPASEYDALCDLVASLCDEMGDEDALAVMRFNYGEPEAEWLSRILHEERSRELFAEEASDV